MTISTIYNKIAQIPYFEVVMRNLYWRNIQFLKRFRPSYNNTITNPKEADFDNIIDHLKEQYIEEGSLIIVHSSYEALLGTNLSPKQIIQKLKDLIGESGTIAMPVIRTFKGEPKPEDILTTDVSNLVCEYDPKRTPIVSGLLPQYLMKDKASMTSLFPLNPLTAVGPLAKGMMEHNLDGDTPSPHGPNSSWKFCHDHNAIIIGLGIDMQHYITMIHVAEEAYPNWFYKKWYRLRKFDIITPTGVVRKEVLERDPKWGMLHIAEVKYGIDFRNNNIFREKVIDGINITVIDSRKLVEFLRTKSGKVKGYPYYTFKTLFK